MLYLPMFAVCVCLSVTNAQSDPGSASLSAAARAVYAACAGSFGAAFAKRLWLLVILGVCLF